ncbi:MAG TPA: hypothetical protein PKN47_16860 [Nitrospira sp.]|jgi:hypothetical protein|nr:hypothetical protein [Nitrospira sp.]HNP83134.1 hypothetical protein [Nitrospira sp.]HQR13346.1 hypothetical protein [Nitrospira sp.]
MAHGVDAERQLGMVRREGQSLRSASPTNGRRPDRAEENKRRLEDPNSVLLLPQTKAGMACVSMLYMFDKVIHRLRRAAGSQLSIEQVRNELARVEQWVSRAKVILRELGVGEFELLPQDPYPDLKERSVKAAWRNARVITPRVGDTVRLVPVIRALDNALNSIRLRAEDLTPYVKHFQAVDELVVALHDVIGHVARVTVTEYEPRGAVKAFLNQ